MATRQYIGARYVPKFDGEWNNTKDYDPLIIVSYQGNSYTSRTFVPHGTDITDETYWALTGNYNAQVEAYRQEVIQLNSNIGNIEELKTHSNTIVGSINEIYGEYDTNKYYNLLEQLNFKGISQDCDIYDNKLFGLSSDGVLKVIDIDTGTVLATSNLDGTDKPHGNSFVFGRKISNSDPYPVVYISGYNGVDGNNDPLAPGLCFVYKINADYSTQLLQKISIGFTSNDSLWNSTARQGSIRLGNFVPDIEHNYLYCQVDFGGTPSTRFFKFLLPTFSDSEITLNTSDIIEYFDVPFYIIPQGIKYHNNKMYFVTGSSDYTNSRYVVVVDLINKCQITSIPLSDLFAEMESVIVMDDDICVSGNDGNQQMYFYKIPDFTVYGNIGNLIDMHTVETKNVAKAVGETYDRTITKTTRKNNSNINSITTSAGTIVSLDCNIQYNSVSVLNVMVDIRISDLVASDRPTINLKDESFVGIPVFLLNSSPTVRYDGNDRFIGDGYKIYKESQSSDTIKLTAINYIGAAPAGHMLILV